MKIKDLVHPPHIRASNGIIKINATVEAKKYTYDNEMHPVYHPKSDNSSSDTFSCEQLRKNC